MIDLTTAGTYVLPHWLSATFDKSFPADWEPIARSYLELVDIELRETHPERVEVFFDVVEGKLQLSMRSVEFLPWAQAHSLKVIATRCELLANTGNGPQGEGTEGSSTQDIVGTPLPVIEDPTSADASETQDCAHEELPLTLINDNDNDNDNDVEVEVEVDENSIEETPGNNRPVWVFSGTGLRSSSDAASAGRDDDTNKRLKATMHRLRDRGSFRPLQYPVLDWRTRLDSVELEFPNFSAVVRTIIRPHLSLLSQGRLHRMVPTLLLGEPGVGKTQFARELQAIMDVPSLFLVMAGETNGSGLCGSSTFWSNSSPGKLFEEVAWGNGRDPVANPLVIVDEVDKVGADRYDPLAGLYSLLEVETAARFEDQSVPGVFLDLSNLRFILTANDESAIPVPLRSRVRTFHIEQPDAGAMKRITQRMYESLLNKYNLDLKAELPASVLNEILGIGPRESKIRLEAAIAIAVTNDQKELDLVSWRQSDCGGGVTARRMGFL